AQTADRARPRARRSRRPPRAARLRALPRLERASRLPPPATAATLAHSLSSLTARLVSQRGSVCAAPEPLAFVRQRRGLATAPTWCSAEVNRSERHQGVLRWLRAVPADPQLLPIRHRGEGGCRRRSFRDSRPSTVGLCSRSGY